MFKLRIMLAIYVRRKVFLYSDYCVCKTCNQYVLFNIILKRTGSERTYYTTRTDN